MEIKIRKYRDIHIIILEGELDLYNAPDLERAFTALMNKGVSSFILDFEKVNYIDSSGVGILLKLRNLSDGNNLRFLLSSIEGEVSNVLKLTNLFRLFISVPDYRSGVKVIERNLISRRSTDQ